VNRTRIVLADDHAVVREGLRILIDSQRDLKVVAEATSGQEALERVRETQARVLCLDLSMPGWSGVQTIKQVNLESPGTRVLVLTMHNDLAYVRSAIAAGALGYCLKSSHVSELLSAIRNVAAGSRAVDPNIQIAYGEFFSDHSVLGCTELSRREREVLELLVRGHTHQEIADKMFLSVKTVETYHARVREKTGLKTRADFVRYGVDSGLLSQDSKGSRPPAE
jgi:two-component system, NarL family, response regulator NreC